MNANFGDDAVGEHSGVFGTTFSRGWAAQYFTDPEWLKALIRVEATLLTASARADLVPAEAAQAIRHAWAAHPVALEDVGAGAAAGGNPVIPLVNLLKATVPESYRQYVHLGATSQDIMDTALMLLVKQAAAVLVRDLSAAADAAAALAARHAHTPMVGRTLMQDALPVSFGFKAVGWTAGLDGAAARVAAVAASLPVQYGGPVGTFSGSQGRGRQMRAYLAEELDLQDPALAWHTVRLPVADLAGAFGSASGIAGKVAMDIVLLAQTAVSEADEGVSGRGGSSSMAHKHNPIAAISARACAMRTPGLVGTLLASMSQEHERAAGAWHAEWETIADLTRLTGSAAAWLADSLQNLAIDIGRMGLAVEALGSGSTGLDSIEEAGRIVETYLAGRRQGPPR